MKRNGKKSRKIRKLIVACTLSAVVLIVSTYTWFIGMQAVNVSPFEIEIATTEGLFLSLDGESWVYNLDVNDAPVYDGNTNTWATDGLKPISTVGDLDSSVSRLKLFEKASLTTSPGGYRLLSSRVDNYTKTTSEVNGVDVTTVSQGDGYIAFDLFVKNLSGHAYYETNEPKNEEAIYLTVDSIVEVDSSGSTDQLLTGIENSIRVGFAQIGRVNASTTDTSVITSMDCDGDSTNKVTGICRNAQIWEPNETKHVQNALNWYGKSCITRKSTGENITLDASYNVSKNTENKIDTATYCYADGGVTKTYMAANNNALPTYAISNEIKPTENVDVYDGAEFNTYTATTTNYDTYKAAEDKSSFRLVKFPYFTDTMKEKKGMDRPEFMSLAPNSITKVRVYVWLEGQDIDNYDFAQLGKTVKINFGFTKERFTEDDVDYVGPDLVTSDNADISTPEVNG